MILQKNGVIELQCGLGYCTEEEQRFSNKIPSCGLSILWLISRKRKRGKRGKRRKRGTNFPRVPRIPHFPPGHLFYIDLFYFDIFLFRLLLF